MIEGGVRTHMPKGRRFIDNDPASARVDRASYWRPRFPCGFRCVCQFRHLDQSKARRTKKLSRVRLISEDNPRHPARRWAHRDLNSITEDRRPLRASDRLPVPPIAAAPMFLLCSDPHRPNSPRLNGGARPQRIFQSGDMSDNDPTTARVTRTKRGDRRGRPAREPVNIAQNRRTSELTRVDLFRR
jgi:hypothetical protein